MAEYYQHDGINVTPEHVTPPYDTWCPLMGEKGRVRLNYYEQMCRIRQRNPDHRRTCYPVCRYKRK